MVGHVHLRRGEGGRWGTIRGAALARPGVIGQSGRGRCCHHPCPPYPPPSLPPVFCPSPHSFLPPSLPSYLPRSQESSVASAALDHELKNSGNVEPGALQKPLTPILVAAPANHHPCPPYPPCFLSTYLPSCLRCSTRSLPRPLITHSSIQPTSSQEPCRSRCYGPTHPYHPHTTLTPATAPPKHAPTNQAPRTATVTTDYMHPSTAARPSPRQHRSPARRARTATCSDAGRVGSRSRARPWGLLGRAAGSRRRGQWGGWDSGCTRMALQGHTCHTACTVARGCRARCCTMAIRTWPLRSLPHLPVRLSCMRTSCWMSIASQAL